MTGLTIYSTISTYKCEWFISFIREKSEHLRVFGTLATLRVRTPFVLLFLYKTNVFFAITSQNRFKLKTTEGRILKFKD